MSKTSIKNMSFGLLIAIIILALNFFTTNVSAESYFENGGYAKVIRHSDVTGMYGGIVGQVDPGEGVTVIQHAEEYILIQFNTLDGAMTGYVHEDILENKGICNTSVVGFVTQTTNTYYSPNYNLVAGSVSSDEIVAVLAQEGNWLYIEYNATNAMRKRAYIPGSYISFTRLSSTRPLSAFYQSGTPTQINIYSTKTVYSGPNGSSYVPIGSVSSDDNGKMYYYGNPYYDRDGDVMYYIKYPTSSGYKYGYIYA